MAENQYMDELLRRRQAVAQGQPATVFAPDGTLNKPDMRSEMVGRGTAGSLPPIAAPGTTQPAVNYDPLGMGAAGYQKRMDELASFSATSPELRYQRDTAAISRLPQGDARTAAELALLQSRSQPAPAPKRDVRNVGDALVDVTPGQAPSVVYQAPGVQVQPPPAVPLQQYGDFYRSYNDGKGWGEWKRKDSAIGDPVMRAFAEKYRAENGLPPDVGGGMDWGSVPKYGDSAAPQQADPAALVGAVRAEHPDWGRDQVIAEAKRRAGM